MKSSLSGLLIIAGILMSSMVLLSWSSTPSHQRSLPKFFILVRSINNDNRDGVTRIAVDLQGRPSTSSRIDSVILQQGDNEVMAIDIDGVDFERYFQWDDEGIVAVEIDFPRRSKFSPADSLHFITSDGKISSALGSNVLKHLK